MALLSRFSKECLPCNFLIFILTFGAFSFLINCSGSNYVSSNHRQDDGEKQLLYENNPAVNGQKIPDDRFQSLQLYKGSQTESLPAIRLGSDEYLILRFDEMTSSGRLYKITFSHRNADWSDSNLMAGTYLKGFREDVISENSPGSSQEPHYVHYRYRFPNDRIQFRYSGNYLLEVRSYETGELLFSLPFFIHEHQGDLQTEIEEIYNLSPAYFLHHQPFLRYRYPSFVTSPDMDITMGITQNRFWGRTVQTQHHDSAEFGVYRGYIDRDDSFIGMKEFRPLRIRRYDDAHPEIIRINPETIPVEVFLFRDVVNLNVSPRLRHMSYFGLPRHHTRSRYVNVQFELQYEPSEDPIYVYGPFNHWQIREENRLRYRPETRSWHGSALIKEGEYIYSYAVVDQDRIDDVRLDASFSSSRLEYTYTIYYRDPLWQADRLLFMKSQWTR
ncbi:DUF5103 domain-containing protein [Balneolaceae bacterium ANBcel3]|nr:DUF5103 domain-containing protein [Balneolaceae bacterium ANBcel3]